MPGADWLEESQGNPFLRRCFFYKVLLIRSLILVLRSCCFVEHNHSAIVNPELIVRILSLSAMSIDITDRIRFINQFQSNTKDDLTYFLNQW